MQQRHYNLCVIDPDARTPPRHVWNPMHWLHYAGQTKPQHAPHR
jgi:hypothetical protein